MLDFDNIQDQLHKMLKKYAENKRLKENSIIAGEIPQPALVVFVGNQMCKEAASDIIPEMKRHWPKSFTETGRGRLLYLLIDRNKDNDGMVGDECGTHCCLTSQEPLLSLKDNLDDCEKINSSIKSLCEKAVAVKDIKNIRIIAATSIEEPDSLITGEVLALCKQFVLRILHRRNVEGELFAFLPHRETLQEKGSRQSYDFFVKWKDWIDVNGIYPDIFMRYGTRNWISEAKGGVPAVGRTLIFDCVDNRGISDDGWRNRLMIDVLEVTKPVDAKKIYTPGEYEYEVNEEYVLLKAMHPDRWILPSEQETPHFKSAGEIRQLMENEINGTYGDDIEVNIRKWLKRACVVRVEEVIGSRFRDDKLEEYFFGTSIMRMFAEFKREFLSRDVPDSILRQITGIKDEDQLERTMKYLEDIISDTKDQEIPDRGIYSSEGYSFSYKDIWKFKEERIVPAYLKLAPKCMEVLIHNWAIKCREVLASKRSEIKGTIDYMARFAEICTFELNLESNYWGEINYDGPLMRDLNSRDETLYKEAVQSVMENPNQDTFYRLFRLVDNNIVGDRADNKNYSAKKRVRAACHTTNLYPLAPDGGVYTIDDGVSCGREITFTVVPNLEFSSFLFECIEDYSENEE